MDDTDTRLAELRGEVAALGQVTETRLGRLEQDVTAARATARAAHQRLDVDLSRMAGQIRDELKPLQDAIHGLLLWRARVLGIVAGISIVSSLLSAAVVVAVTRLL